MLCPLCGARKARRGCPALAKEICAVCCGTKRLVQIRCPSDCTWLAAARQNPPAVVLRQQQRDMGLLVPLMRDLSQRQSQIFILVNTVLARYEPAEFQPLVDDDVAEASEALASTFETSARGVIYDHRPASLAAERLVAALKPVLAEAGQGAGSAFERDAALVLRRIADASRDARRLDPGNTRIYLDTVGRIIPKTDPGSPDATAAEPTASRLIIP